LGPDGNIWFAAGSNGVPFIGQFIVQWQYYNLYPVPSTLGSVGTIVAGADGYLWFASSNSAGQAVIARMTSDGASFSSFAVPTPTAALGGLAVGADGNIWFTEYFGNKIGHITPLTGVISEFTLPTANTQLGTITTGADGNLWFTENGLSKIGR